MKSPGSVKCFFFSWIRKKMVVSLLHLLEIYVSWILLFHRWREWEEESAEEEGAGEAKEVKKKKARNNTEEATNCQGQLSVLQFFSVLPRGNRDAPDQEATSSGGMGNRDASDQEVAAGGGNILDQQLQSGWPISDEQMCERVFGTTSFRYFLAKSVNDKLFDKTSFKLTPAELSGSNCMGNTLFDTKRSE